MNEDLKEKIDALTIELRRRQQIYRRSLRNIVLISLVTVLFFALYSALVIYRIREIATPSTISALIGEEMRLVMVQNLTQVSPAERMATIRDMAQSNSNLVFLAIPEIGGWYRNQMSRATDHSAVKIAQLMQPAFHQQIDRMLAEKRCPDDFVSAIVSGTLPLMRKQDYPWICYPLNVWPGKMADYLRELGYKSADELTRKEACDLDVMLCLLTLWDSNRYKDSQYARYPLEFLAAALDEIHQKKTKNSPMIHPIPVKK